MQLLRSSLPILYSDAAITVVSKPPGLLSVPGLGLPRLAANAATLVSDWWWAQARAGGLPRKPSYFGCVEGLESKLATAPEEVYLDPVSRMLRQHETLSAAQRRQVNVAGVLPYIATAAAVERAALPGFPPEVLPGPLQLHRLDELTSGLLFFANTLPVQRALSMQWQSRAVRKVYEAIVDTRVLEAMQLASRDLSLSRLPPAFTWACTSPILTQDEGEVTSHLQPSSHSTLYKLLPSETSDSGVAARGGRSHAALEHAAGEILAALAPQLESSQSHATSSQSKQQELLLPRMAARFAALMRDWHPQDTPLDASLSASLLAHPQEGAKPSLTRWKVLERSPGMVRLRLEPLTGRTHQLRLHCALPPPFGLGAPIIGDHFYGDPSAVPRSFFFVLLARTLQRMSLAATGASSCNLGLQSNRAAAVSPDTCSSNCESDLTIGHLLFASHAMREAWLPWLVQVASDSSAGGSADLVLHGWKRKFLSMGLAHVATPQESVVSAEACKLDQRAVEADEEPQSFLSDSCRGEVVTTIQCKAAAAAHAEPNQASALLPAGMPADSLSGVDMAVDSANRGSASALVGSGSVVMRRALLHASEVHLPDHLPHASAYAATANDAAQMEEAIKRCDKRLKEAARAAERAASAQQIRAGKQQQLECQGGSGTDDLPSAGALQQLPLGATVRPSADEEPVSPFSNSDVISDGKIFVRRDSEEWKAAMAAARARWPIVDVTEKASSEAFRQDEAMSQQEVKSRLELEPQPEPELTLRAYEAAVDTTGKGRPVVRRIVVFRNPPSF